MQENINNEINNDTEKQSRLDNVEKQTDLSARSEKQTICLENINSAEIIFSHRRQNAPRVKKETAAGEVKNTNIETPAKAKPQKAALTLPQQLKTDKEPLCRSGNFRTVFFAILTVLIFICEFAIFLVLLTIIKPATPAEPVLPAENAAGTENSGNTLIVSSDYQVLFHTEINTNLAAVGLGNSQQLDNYDDSNVYLYAFQLQPSLLIGRTGNITSFSAYSTFEDYNNCNWSAIDLYAELYINTDKSNAFSLLTSSTLKLEQTLLKTDKIIAFYFASSGNLNIPVAEGSRLLVVFRAVCTESGYIVSFYGCGGANLELSHE